MAAVGLDLDRSSRDFGAFCQGMLGLNHFLPTIWFSEFNNNKKTLAVEQKATESAETAGSRWFRRGAASTSSCLRIGC